jgi:twinkle protein
MVVCFVILLTRITTTTKGLMTMLVNKTNQAAKTGQPCIFDDCKSSDAGAFYKDHFHCYSCGKQSRSHNLSTWATDVEFNQHKVYDKRQRNPINGGNEMIGGENLLKNTGEGFLGSVKHRSLSKDACTKYNLLVDFFTDEDGNKDKANITKHIFEGYDEDGELVSRKIRSAKPDSNGKKKCFIEGDIEKSMLFGTKAFPSGCAKKVTITEGEIDAVSYYQMTGYPAVSLRNGAEGVSKDMQDPRIFNYLNSFDEVYVCMDADKNGRKAANIIASVFGPKARIVRLDETLNDINAYLMENKIEDFKKVWWKAEQVKMDGVVTGNAIREKLRNRTTKECFDLPWKGLNDYTYGYRMGETIVVTAQAKVGKTAVLRQIAYDILKNDTVGHKVGGIFLEGTLEDNLEGFVSIEAKKPLHLPDVREQMSDEEYEKHMQAVPFENLVMYHKDGVIQPQQILQKIRWFIEGFGCKFIILDNLMSLMSASPNDDERKALNSFMNELVTLAETKEVCICIVAHLNRSDEIYGTGQIEKQANLVITLKRDKLNNDHLVRNTTEVVVKENRFCGETGLACLLRYNPKTGMLEEVMEESDNPFDDEGDDVPVFDNSPIMDNPTKDWEANGSI